MLRLLLLSLLLLLLLSPRLLLLRAYLIKVAREKVVGTGEHIHRLAVSAVHRTLGARCIVVRTGAVADAIADHSYGAHVEVDRMGRWG